MEVERGQGGEVERGAREEVAINQVRVAEQIDRNAGIVSRSQPKYVAPKKLIEMRGLSPDRPHRGRACQYGYFVCRSDSRQRAEEQK